MDKQTHFNKKEVKGHIKALAGRVAEEVIKDPIDNENTLIIVACKDGARAISEDFCYFLTKMLESGGEVPVVFPTAVETSATPEGCFNIHTNLLPKRMFVKRQLPLNSSTVIVVLDIIHDTGDYHALLTGRYEAEHPGARVIPAVLFEKDKQREESKFEPIVGVKVPDRRYFGVGMGDEDDKFESLPSLCYYEE